MATQTTTNTPVKGEVYPYPVEMPLTERELLLYGDELASLDSLRMRFSCGNVQAESIAGRNPSP